MATIYNTNQKTINLPYQNTAYNGSTLATTATGTVSWAQPNYNFYDGSSPVMTIPTGGKTVILEEAATLEVKGNVKINGVDLEERLSTIEKVLQIPQRDVIMESKYPKLADLYRQYMHELEKLKTWDALKESK